MPSANVLFTQLKKKKTLIKYIDLISSFERPDIKGERSSCWAPVANGKPCGLLSIVLAELQDTD